VLAKKLVPLEEDLSYLQIQKAIQIEAVQYQQELDAEWGKSLWAEMQKHDLADFHFLLDWEKVHPAPGEWQDWWWKLIKNLDPVDDLYENYLADLSGQIKKRWQEYRGWEQKQHLEFLIDQLKQAEEKQNYLKIQDLLREQVDILNAEEYESWFKKAAYLELKARESAQKKDLDRCLQKLEKYQLEADDQLLWDTFLAYSDIFNQEKYHFYKQKALNILKTAVTRWINSDQFILSRAVLDFLTERNEEVADLQSLYQKQEENFNLINNIPQDKTAQSKNRILLAYQKWINNKELNYEDDVSWQYLLQKEPVLTVVLNHLQLDQKAQNAEKWRQNSYAETIANFTDASLLLDWAKLNFSVLSYENLCRFQSQYLNLEREKNLQRLEACQAQSENILAYIRPFLLAEPDWVFQQEYYQPYFQAEVKSPHTQVSTAEYYYYWEKGEYEEAKKYLLNLPLAELLVAVQKIDDYEKQQDRIFWQKKFAAGVALLEKYLYKNDWEGVDRYFSELNNKLPVDFYLSERISLLEKFQSHFAQMKSELSMQINDYLQNNQFSSAQNLLVDLKEWESKVKILYQKWQTKLQAFQLAVNDLEKFIEKQDLDRIEHLLVLTEGSFSLPEQKYLQKLYRQFLEQKKWQNLDFLALLEDYLNNEDFKGLQQELEALEFKDLNYWTWKSKLTLAQNTQKEKIGSLNWQKNQEKILKCAQTKNESLFYVTIKRLDDNQAWQLAVLYWTELAQKTLADFRDYLVQIRKQFKADPSLIEAELSKINSQLLELCTWGDKSVIDDFWEFLQELHQVFNELNLNWGHGLVTHTCLEDKENNSALRLLQTEGDLVKWRQFLLSHLPKLDYQTWLSSWEALIQEEKTLAMANYEALIRLKEQELSQAYEENNSLGFQAKMAEMAELLSYTDFCKLQETWKKAMQKMYELQLKEDKKTQKLKEARVKELEKIVRMNLKAYNMEELETYYQELELLGELSLVQKLKQETQKVCSSRDYQKFLIRKLIAEKRFDEADQLLKQL
ncbi:MAG TPA: hypothetical protein PLQ36_01610, partial [Candidatus Gracilibacteria bacterium]|nr:hypothetical protein [Candidatus Gracilibacteria bacterium]